MIIFIFFFPSSVGRLIQKGDFSEQLFIFSFVFVCLLPFHLNIHSKIWPKTYEKCVVYIFAELIWTHANNFCSGLHGYWLWNSHRLKMNRTDRELISLNWTNRLPTNRRSKKKHHVQCVRACVRACEWECVWFMWNYDGDSKSQQVLIKSLGHKNRISSVLFSWTRSVNEQVYFLVSKATGFIFNNRF